MYRPASIVALLLLSLAVPALAQDASAPPLSATEKKLYLHHMVADASELTGWMNTIVADGDDTAMGLPATCSTFVVNAQGNPVYTHTGNRATDEPILGTDEYGSDISRHYTVPLLPAQAGVMKLDPAGKIKFALYAGAGTCFGLTNIKVTLMAGETKVVEATATGHWFDNAAAVYPVSNVEATPLVTDVPLDNVTLLIDVSGRYANAFFLGVSAGKGSSSIELPILEISDGGSTEPGAPIEETLADAATRTIALEATSSQVFRYNWTSTGGTHTLSVAGNLSVGTVDLRVSAGPTELVSKSLSGDFENIADLDPTLGTWTIELAFQGARGNVTVDIAPSTGGGTGTGGGTSGTGNGGTAGTGNAGTGSGSGSGGDGNGTSEAPGDKGGIPVPWIVPVLAVGAALMLRRRREG